MCIFDLIISVIIHRINANVRKFTFSPLFLFCIVNINSGNQRYWKTNISGSSSGPLHGKRIAIKDNIAVAGVPMMNGSHVMEGYVPEFDATVVTRVLDAGFIY